jgi:2-C-methyl-D-erythritol 4-phosphate cytidylyltransferase
MYSLVLLNGGVGVRAETSRPKQLVNVRGIPILVYSLVAVDAVAEITQIIVNYPQGWREQVERIIEDYAIRTPVTLVEAGASRHESVALMLATCDQERVIIHESARPLVRTRDFAALIAAPHENVAFMLPIPFTVAPVDPVTREVTGSLERARLRNVQLPQKFLTRDLAAAHEFARERGETYTEDSTLVAVSGHPVHFIDGTDTNIKVTTPTDVRLAGFLMQETDADDE